VNFKWNIGGIKTSEMSSKEKCALRKFNQITDEQAKQELQ